MAGIKNYIETVVRLNTAKAQKGAQDLFNKIKTGSRKASTSLKKVDKSVDKVGNSALGAGAKVKKGFGGIGAMFTQMRTAVTSMIPALGSFKIALISTGVGAIIVALGAFIGLMYKAAKAGADYSKAISGLKAVAGATKEEIGQLSAQAKELGSTTAFTASQVVSLQTELAKLGFSVIEIGDATPSILDLAASLDVDLAEAASFAGGTINAFGLETTETQRVVDVMAKTAVSSAQDFTTLRESFSKAAPAANALGLTIERTGALLGVLSDSSIKGSEAGTALKNSFIELKKKGLTLDEGLDKIAGSSDKLLTAIELAGKRGGPALLVLANKRHDIAELQDKLEGAAGAAAEIAEIRLDNLAGDVTKLGSAWEGFLLNIEDGTGALNTLGRGAIQGLTGFIKILQGVIELTAFRFKEMWTASKNYTNGAVQGISGSLLTLQGYIQVFAAEAMKAISSIPIIGEQLDQAKIDKNLADANATLQIGLKRIQESKDTFAKQSMLNDTAMFRFADEQAKKTQRLEEIKEQKKKDALAEKAKEDAAKLGDGSKEMGGLTEDGAKLAEKKAQADLDAQLAADQKAVENLEITEELKRAKLREIQEKYAEDDNALEQAKLDRRREKELAEIDGLAVTMQAKEDLKDQLNANFDAKDELLEQEKRQKQRDNKATEDQIDADIALEKKLEDAELQLEIDAENLELAKLRGLDTLEMEKDLIDQKMAYELMQAGLTEDEIQKIKKRGQVAKEVLDAKSFIATKKTVDKEAKAGLEAAADAFGVSQELAVAQMLIKAPKAIAGSFTKAAEVYAPPVSLAMGAAGAAATIIPIIKGLQDIKKTRFPGAKPSRGGNISGGALSGGGGGALGAAPALLGNLSANNAARLGDQGISNGASASAANNVLAGASANVTFSESSYQDFRRQVQFKEDKTGI